MAQEIAFAPSITYGDTTIYGTLLVMRGGAAWGFTRILVRYAPESFEWEWNRLEAEDHGSVTYRGTYNGLEWLFREWEAP